MDKLLFLALAGCTALGPGGEIPAIVAGDLSHSGLSWSDLVTSDRYDTLRIVVHHTAGEVPDATSLDHVRTELERLRSRGALHKPGGIELLLGATVPLPGDEHTAEALDDALVGHAVPPTDGGAAVVNVLYASGAYVGDSGGGSILGYAYGGGYLVMLPDSIDHTCHEALGGITAASCEIVEAMVFVHELGHLFGLVDNGVAMREDHADPWRGNHDRSEDCVMYWSIARPDIISVLAESWLVGAPTLAGFCDACVEDLAAAR